MAGAGMTLVASLDQTDDKARQRVMKLVSGILGVESIRFDAGNKKLTVLCGNADPILIMTKLQKKCKADILSIGINEVKKEEKKEVKKEEKKIEKQEFVSTPCYYIPPYAYISPCNNAPANCGHNMEEYPNACVIL